MQLKKRFFWLFLVFSIISLSTSAAAAELMEPDRLSEIPPWEDPAFFTEERERLYAQSAEPRLWQDGEFRGGVYEGFYSQLDDTQKMIYDLIKEAFAEPTREALLEFDEPILLEAEDEDGLGWEDVYQWLYDNMWNQYGGRYAVLRDHPELTFLFIIDYYIEPQGEWIYDYDREIWTGYRMTGMLYENRYPWIPPEAFENPTALEEAANAAAAAIGAPRPSRAATVRAIHDYLCGLVTYKERTSTMPNVDGGEPRTVYYDHTAYSALVTNEAVCNGYASAFKLLCDRYHIPCVHVSGYVEGGGHAWNYVQMENGIWYAVDSTWADGPSIDYSYFLVGENTPNLYGTPFRDSHEVPPSNCDLPASPALSMTGYPYLEAHLDSVPGTVSYGEAIELSLSGIQDLHGRHIINENAGLFAEDSEMAIAAGTIRNGSLSLRYDTADGDLAAGNHTLCVKCTSGQQRGAIIAILEVKLESSPDDGKLHGTVTVSANYAPEEALVVRVAPEPGYRFASIKVSGQDGQQVQVSGSGGVYTFRMPAFDVFIDVDFVKN